MNDVGRAWSVLRTQGIGAVTQKVVLRAFPSALQRPPLVAYDDVLAVDWRIPHRWKTQRRPVPTEGAVVAWIMSPPGHNSGGHQNIFRFVRFLEDSGYHVRIYLYSAIDATTAAEARRRVQHSSSFARINAKMEDLPSGGIPNDVDAIIATGWETAYPSYRDVSNARRFYFVQDFEPLFYPAGTEATLAENTYRFGFIGLTAGEWLAGRLRNEFDMPARSYGFGADSSRYRITHGDRRNAVFFYARPETPRRGFELGTMALDLLTRMRPETTIILAGQDVRRFRLPFRHENPGNLQVGQLNDVYNRCAAGLVLSLTNMSLMPLELLSAGVIPVVNDAANNRLVSDNPFIAYTEPSPQALADRLLGVLDRADQPEYAERAAASVGETDWATAGVQFLEAFQAGLHG